MQTTFNGTFVSRAVVAAALVAQLVGTVACTLGGDIDDVGEACVSDFDCDTDKECVPADSSNASRACMPFAG
jgi:hypothetical protein